MLTCFELTFRTLFIAIDKPLVIYGFTICPMTHLYLLPPVIFIDSLLSRLLFHPLKNLPNIFKILFRIVFWIIFRLVFRVNVSWWVKLLTAYWYDMLRTNQLYIPSKRPSLLHQTTLNVPLITVFKYKLFFIALFF